MDCKIINNVIFKFALIDLYNILFMLILLFLFFFFYLVVSCFNDFFCLIVYVMQVKEFKIMYSCI